MFSRGHQSPSAAGSSNAPLASTGNQQHQDGAHAAGLPHHEKPVQKIRSMLDVDEPVNTQHHSASGTPQYNAPSSQQSREAHPSAAPVMSSGRVEERHQNTTVAPGKTTSLSQELGLFVILKLTMCSDDSCNARNDQASKTRDHRRTDHSRHPHP